MQLKTCSLLCALSGSLFWILAECFGRTPGPLLAHISHCVHLSITARWFLISRGHFQFSKPKRSDWASVSEVRDNITEVGVAQSIQWLSCELEDRGSIRARGEIFFSSPPHPDRLWGPPNLLWNGYKGLFPRGFSGRGVKLTTHLHLVPRLRLHGVIPPLTFTSSWRCV
jgi:hypothetical protein